MAPAAGEVMQGGPEALQVPQLQTFIMSFGGKCYAGSPGPLTWDFTILYALQFSSKFLFDISLHSLAISSLGISKSQHHFPQTPVVSLTKLNAASDLQDHETLQDIMG